MHYWIWFLGYAILVFANAGALLAKQQNVLGGRLMDEFYREDLGFSILLSLIPPTWLLTLFITGFYEHGWQIRRKRVEGQ